MTKPLTPTLLLILDGWGIAPAGLGNATSVAATPHMDALLASCPHSELSASGRDVGLPHGYIGNSEVGHLNIGAGRVVYQDMTRIDVAMEKGELDSNPVFQTLLGQIRAVNAQQSRSPSAHARPACLHLAGLLSDGGVHSHIEHLKALARAGAAGGVDVLIHCFLDGRDTNPHHGVEYVQNLQAALDTINSEAAQQPTTRGKARVASLCGRFYAMDRDKRWERVQEVWELLAHGKGASVTDAVQALRDSYAAGLTDEFVHPTLIADAAYSHLQDGDGLFFFNFRADRMRELVQALTLPDFDGFARGTVPQLVGIASMTSYDASFTLPVAFPKKPLSQSLGEVLSGLGYKQLRLAETEKYAHVTYFFNGGREEPLPGEDRIMVPSPRDVATYDLAPAMSCAEVTDKFIEAWKSEQYTLVVCNLANGDMVGHTGVLPAAVSACETVDSCLGRMVEAVRASHGRMLIIADHGNCESMISEEGEPQTAHTTNPVPCILVDDQCRVLHNGRLADVAPTLLGLWGLDKPELMDGTNLTEQCA